jgi:hypothetical protein
MLHDIIRDIASAYFHALIISCAIAIFIFAAFQLSILSLSYFIAAVF